MISFGKKKTVAEGGVVSKQHVRQHDHATSLTTDKLDEIIVLAKDKIIAKKVLKTFKNPLQGILNCQRSCAA